MAEYIIQDTTLIDLADIIRKQFMAEDVIIALASNRNSLTDIYLVSGITNIADYTFYNCTNLALTSLPEGLTSIGIGAFSHCTNLALTSLPEGLTSIGNGAFSHCQNLKSITFKGTPSNISSTAFDQCYYLTTINVPWSEGEVAGAPWGATNATINYNYIGGGK